MELISVIVPVYKVEQYLNQCISSIVNQTYPNLEIILVDDGSPDNCPAMCDAWAEKDQRIRVIHKPNGGLSDARNAGMAAATGELMAFVDSDDWVDLRYIEYLYDAMKQTNSDISACDLREVYDGQITSALYIRQAEVKTATPEEAINDILHNRRFRAVAWNKLYTREILKNEHFETARLHEDEFFSYRLYDKAERLAYIALPLYNYRKRSGSIMTSFSVRHLDLLDAYLERITLLESKYPRLLLRDKLNFCVACMNLYVDVSSADSSQRTDAQKRIKECRQKIRFTRGELRKCTCKERLYIVMSNRKIIGIACWLRKQKGE